MLATRLAPEKQVARLPVADFYFERMIRAIMTNQHKPTQIGASNGSVTILGRAGKNKHGQVIWSCLCNCGEVIQMLTHSFARGTACKACGKARAARNCVRHGASRSKLYGIWQNMIQRCENENSVSFRWYGAKGIAVCAEWRTGFDAFRAWSETNGYAPGLSIDRIDPSFGYSPSNCRWVTIEENCKHASVGRWTKHKEEKHV